MITDPEKRLRLLRQQVYGKQRLDVGSVKSKLPPQILTSHIPSPISSTQSDATYLYQDLRKVLIFSSLAIGAQLILFILSKNHIINFNIL